MIKDTDNKPTEAGPVRLVLEIRGLGPVPSLKNSKRMVIQKGGKAKPITNPKVKKWMNQAAALIASQCRFGTQTGAGVMVMAPLQAYWIALLPRDDCWTVIPELVVTSQLCEPGEEGATITIERIQ